MERIENSPTATTINGVEKPSRILQRGLRDSSSIGMPIDLTPEWPHITQEHINGLIDETYQDVTNLEISGKITPAEAEILYSQVSAIDYLYGRREKAIDDEFNENPLVDILTLISGPDNFEMAVDAQPRAKRYFGRVDGRLKPDQYTYVDFPSGKKEFRTIPGLEDKLSTTIRGLYVLGEAAKHHPIIIPTALHQYTSRFEEEDSSLVTDTAIGLLEILNTTNLLYDPRFYVLSEQLRNVVFQDVSDYTDLKQRYPYTVTSKRAFWYKGEVDANRRKRIKKYIQTEDGKRTEINSNLEFRFPNPSNWIHQSRKRQEMRRQAKELTMASSLRRNAVNFEEDKVIREIVSDRLKKADLKERVRNLEKEQLESLTRGWRRFLSDEIDEGAEITEDEIVYLNEALTLILNHFSQDEKLSQKAKTNIRGLTDPEIKNSSFYPLKSENRADDALFSIIFALRNPRTAQELRNSLGNEENLESFHLLLKLIAYQTIEASFNKKETDFLFDPSYRQKFSPEQTQNLFDQLRKLADKFVPDVKEITKVSIAKGDTEIEDLLSEEYLQKTKAKLEKLTHRKIFNLLRYPKSRQFTVEDRQLTKQIAKLAPIIPASVLVGMLASGFVDESSARNNLETSRASYLAQRKADLEGLLKIDLSSRLQSLNGNGESLLTSIDNIWRESSFPENWEDRIPDSRDYLKNREGMDLIWYGKILNLPEKFQGFNGEKIAYFPFEISLQNREFAGVELKSWYQDEMKDFPQAEIVDSIDAHNPEFVENQLAFIVNDPHQRIIPPTGWKIVRLIQEKGEKPQIGGFGDIYFNPESIPSRVILVFEEEERTWLSPKISEYQDRVLPQYTPQFYAGTTDQVRSMLSEDENLQLIYFNFVTEMETLSHNTWDSYNNHKISYEDFKKLYAEESSKIGIEYALKYANYTKEHRFYALGFQANYENPDDFGKFSVLESIANQKDEGYFCSVASYGFREFMSSAGFWTATQPGISLHNINGYLVGTITHRNNILFLPDGRVLEVDVTPAATSQSPTEDLLSNARDSITPADVEKILSNISGSFNSEEGIIPNPNNSQAHRRNEYNPDDYKEALVLDKKRDDVLLDLERNIENMLTERVSQNTSLTPGEDFGIEKIDDLKRILYISELALSSTDAIDIVSGQVTGKQVLQASQNYERLGIELANLHINSLEPTIEEINDINSKYLYMGRNIIKEYEDKKRQMVDLMRRRGPSGINYDATKQERIRQAIISAELSDQRMLDRYIEDKKSLEEHQLNFIHALKKISNEKLNSAVQLNQVPTDVETEAIHQGLDYQESSQTSWDWDAEQYIFEAFGLKPQRYESYAREFQKSSENTWWINHYLSEENKKILESLPEHASTVSGLMGISPQFMTPGQRSALSEANSDLNALSDGLHSTQDSKYNDELGFQKEVERLRLYSKAYRLRQNRSEEQQKEENVDIARLASNIGISLASTAFALIGISAANEFRKQRKIADRIEKSFESTKIMKIQEKELSAAIAGTLSLLTYDEKFPEKSATILNLLANYSSEKHENSINWLLNEGFDVLVRKSSLEAYQHMVFSANGGSKDGSFLKEVKRSFPSQIGEDVDRLANKNGNKDDTADSNDIPYEFEIAYNLAKLISTHHMASLMRDVFTRLEIQNGSSELSVNYKIEDLYEILMEKYALEDTPESVKPLFNSIYEMLRDYDGN